jgi:hypothetical protein
MLKAPGSFPKHAFFLTCIWIIFFIKKNTALSTEDSLINPDYFKFTLFFKSLLNLIMLIELILNFDKDKRFQS